jgi:hypothetical protein
MFKDGATRDWAPERGPRKLAMVPIRPCFDYELTEPAHMEAFGHQQQLNCMVGYPFVVC